VKGGGILFSRPIKRVIFGGAKRRRRSLFNECGHLRATYLTAVKTIREGKKSPDDVKDSRNH